MWLQAQRKRQKEIEFSVHSDEVDLDLRVMKDREIRKGLSTKVANDPELNTTKAPSALAQ